MIVLTNNRKHEFQIDAEDFAKIFPYKWHLSWHGYPRAWVTKDKPKLMHCFIMGPPPKGKEIDHINGDKLDNRKANLRFCTASENQCNRTKKGANKYIGVYAHKVGFHASINKDKKMFYLGYFKSAKKAAKARDLKAIELHGEFAVLNFPKK